MTDLKFNILKLLYNSHPLREQRFGKILHSVPEDPILVKNALSELSSSGIIENLTCSDIYKLTDLGEKVFEQIQEEREQVSKQECQQRFDNKISVANLLIPLVTFILGFFVDHCPEVFSFLSSIFK